ncbi:MULTISPECIES: DNA-3-methyladenine glycosylase I [unclassified Streptomyces]|uniref:DNA-3-methyladenine glycosylase I n=1 Tax=unclassified Streptomyces TaxID=2593676 RepID=UPI00325607BF
MKHAEHRCAWADSSDLMAAYHDEEWGRASHDDRYLFEFLVLEGAQAGLSWSTVLNKRANYRRLLDGFDPVRIAEYDEDKLAELLGDPGIVRNRLKVASLVKNARAFLAVQEEFGSFDAYLWQWTDGKPVVNRPGPGDPLPTSTELSDRISKDLKRRGMNFVGTTIVYAYLEAVGVVDDHWTGCPVAAAPQPG